MFACPHCERYLQDKEDLCPFCKEQVSASESGAAMSAGERLSRSANYALRAVLIAAPGAVLACGGSIDGEDGIVQGQASGGSESKTEPQSTGGVAAASGGQSSSGGQDGGKWAFGSGGDDNIEEDIEYGGQGGEAFAPVPIYGGPFPDMMRAKV